MVTSSSIYVPDNWLDPLDWRAVFGRDGPVEVDIGCGKGAFLLGAAAMQPGHNFFGIDRLLARLRKVDAHARRRDLRNVRLLRLEAGYCVSYLVPDCSVSAYHIYCPDPWPKRRHRSRRLLNDGFVAALHRTLCPHGVIKFSTDDQEYFEATQSVFRVAQRFCEIESVTRMGYQLTDFEQMFAEQGRTIYRSQWEKR